MFLEFFLSRSLYVLSDHGRMGYGLFVNASLRAAVRISCSAVHNATSQRSGAAAAAGGALLRHSHRIGERTTSADVSRCV